MGVKKFFKIKPPEEESDEVNKDTLLTMGIPVKDPSRKKRSKFEAFNTYSKERRENASKILQPIEVNKSRSPPSPVSPHQGTNPYAGMNFEEGNNNANPYPSSASNEQENSYERNDLYPESNLTKQSNLWTPPVTPISRHDHSFLDENTPSMNNNTILNPYRSRRSTMSPRSSNSLSRRASTATRDEINAKNSLFQSHSPTNSYNYGEDHVQIQDEEEEEEDLNAIPEYEPSINLNDEPNVSRQTTARAYDFDAQRQLQLQQEQEEEDEEVDRIKQDIKFTKQQSVASTRNTMRMATEAEASGQNTLGMLGSQSEKLYGIERDLLLAKTQNNIATDKVKELAKLDKSFMLVHVSNPFNSRARMRQQEEKVRNQITEDKLIQQKLRAQQYNAETNIIAGLQEADRAEVSKPELTEKYDRLQRLQKASKYQFEKDDEDDEMELEISKNLDAIELSTRKLKNMANTIGKEVNTQQQRWRRVEDDTDDLDMEIHLNNHRLGGVMK